MRALALVLLLAAGPALAAAPSPEAVSKKEKGDGRRDAGDATGALAAYKEATQASPDYIEAWEEIGKLYFGAKKFPEAAESFQRAVEIDGSYANNWFNLALARRRAGQLDRARDAFRRYVLLKPDDADGRLRLADVLRALDDRDGAIKEYEAVVVAADARTATPQQGERAKEALAQLRAAGAPARTVTIVPVAPVAPVAPAPAAPVATAPTAAAPATTESPAPAVTAAPVPAPAPAVPPAVVPAPAAPAAPPPRLEPVAPPSPALLDKLALGEKLQASGDHRGALFAFQDAVYLEPRNALARVKLGRAYWMLRYVGQADEQWQQAMQLAPNDPSIARMIEDARKAPRPAITEPAGAGGAPPPSPAVADARPPAEAPRVYKFVPEGQGVPAQPAAPQYGATTPGYGLPPAQSAPVSPPTYAPPAAQPSYPPGSYGQQAYPPQQPAYPPQQPAYPQPPVEQPSSYPPAQQPWAQQPAYGQQPYAQPQYGQPQYPQPAYPAQQPAYAQPPAPVPQQPSASAAAAAQHYRAALSLYIQRDYLGAIAELDASITLDPNLSVAYTARGSAKFGLRKYREAAADYKAAIDLDTTRAEPIWGLAECQRMLGDPAAVDTYRRYAASIASDVNEDRRSKARRWATELSAPSK